MNDLIGLQLAWGAYPGDGTGTVDCCQLAAEVHKRLGYYDYTHEIEHYYKQYTDDSFPRIIIAKWLLRNADRLMAPEPHAVVLLPGSHGGALGTVMDDGRVLCLLPTMGVALASLNGKVGHYFRLRK
jgi:hypothetical protein